ncbi:hypothetical protein Holit_02093 [Hollandina sp. SP2]
MPWLSAAGAVAGRKPSLHPSFLSLGLFFLIAAKPRSIIYTILEPILGRIAYNGSAVYDVWAAL